MTTATLGGESLHARHTRRRTTARSWLSNLRRAAALLPLAWAARGDVALRRVLRSTVLLAPGVRMRLCLFSEPLEFFSHLIRQDHPPHHRDMLFAAPIDTEPFWPRDAHAEVLESNFEAIARECAAVSADVQRHPSTGELVDRGAWSIFPFYKGGARFEENCARCPETVALLEKLPHCVAGSDGLGQMVFSALDPGTTLRPHHGSVNVRLRYHLGVVVPAGATITVGGVTRAMEQGRCTIVDDALEHTATNGGAVRRVTLLLDLWHPALLGPERAFITAATALQAKPS